MTPTVAQSPLTLFADALAARTEIHGGEIAVYLGREHLPRTTGARRIVVVPVDGDYVAPDRERVRHLTAPVIAVASQAVALRIWGESLDHAWEIHARLISALDGYVKAGGYRFKHEGFAWDVDPDASEQGEALTVRIRLLLPLTLWSEGTSTSVESVNATTAIVSPTTGADEPGPEIDVP
jgi:hypothetical protein